MAIIFPQGFKVTSTDAIDSRLVLTKAEMKALLVDGMPNNYLCLCSDDGKLYIWNSAFEKSADLGRFKAYEEIFNLADAFDKAAELYPEALTAQVAKELPKAMKKALEDQEADSGLAVDENGNIKVDFNEDQFDLNDNKVTLAIDIIQAI